MAEGREEKDLPLSSFILLLGVATRVAYFKADWSNKTRGNDEKERLEDLLFASFPANWLALSHCLCLSWADLAHFSFFGVRSSNRKGQQFCQRCHQSLNPAPWMDVAFPKGLMT